MDRRLDQARSGPLYLRLPENNPVTAGLVARAEDYAWPSANERWVERAGKTKPSQECEGGAQCAHATLRPHRCASS